MALVEAATPNGFAPTATVFDDNEPAGLAVAREHAGGPTALAPALRPEQAVNAEDVTLTEGKLPEFGDLPIAFLSCPVGTVRPPDNVIIESTELSGSDAFEEVISLEDIAKLRNPFKDQLEELVKAHGQTLA